MHPEGSNVLRAARKNLGTDSKWIHRLPAHLTSFLNLGWWKGTIKETEEKQNGMAELAPDLRVSMEDEQGHSRSPSFSSVIRRLCMAGQPTSELNIPVRSQL